MPKAPGLFSTTKGWPRLWRICSPTMRVTMSVAPPGAIGHDDLDRLHRELVLRRRRHRDDEDAERRQCNQSQSLHGFLP